MDYRLSRIKRLVTAGRYRFTMKADTERMVDGLSEQDVVESILTAQSMRVKKSRNPKQPRREPLFIIESFNFSGTLVYSKGVIRRVSPNESEYYILISGKRSLRSE